MPASKRPKPLYQRGDFKLYRRDDRKNLEIVWYDPSAKRERSASASTPDDEAGRVEVDRRYLQSIGQRLCETCGRPFEGDASPPLLRAIIDYLLLGEDKAGHKATRARLGHVVEFVTANDPNITCAQVTEQWVNGFRKWLAARPIVAPKSGIIRPRSLGHVEGCVLQLAAAINATPGQRAMFAAEQPKTVAVSPRYRASVGVIASMFRFCLYPEGPKVRSDKEREVFIAYRANLLAYLRAAVATWARPEEIYDIDAAQWASEARVLDLNPAGRRQTRKYRGRIPIARQFAPVLDALEGRLLSTDSIRSSWERMRSEIGLPNQRGEAGEKLIRRSMATIARRRIGEANWRQGEMMLGHVKASISDIYAVRDPANLGLALEVTEAIIDEIETLCPGAYRTVTASGSSLRVVEGGKNG